MIITTGQGGVSAHLRVPNSEVDLGFYAIQYHAKLPVAYATLTQAPGAVSTYQLVYPEKIRSYGVSANTTVLDNVNLGGELLAPVGGEAIWRDKGGRRRRS